ncbi:hypothetical protein [Pseudoalteromonas sp. T1lg22]|uniref:hypothetical protein n=1 Tax=Pseudoalteromonas sp. T1lg22 TaxID=2077096 RepID=UPI000CF6DE80|nr:hypothetical protein [Pseudoalteromonas sp. T1lg22]
MTKKLSPPLKKLLDEHKQAWQIDKAELDRRVQNARISYLKGFPNLGDRESNALVILPYRTFKDAVEALTTTLKDADIDYQRTTIVAGGTYRIAFTKPQQEQDQELEALEKQIASEYKAELTAIKESYIENLLIEQEEQARVDAENKHSLNQQKLKEALLSII